MINFDMLLEENGDTPVNPREIFLTLTKTERFSFLRDVQNEVLQAWFERRDRKDSVIKLNVGSGKTLVGLLALQTSLNEGIAPAVYVAPDRLLSEQVMEEAKALGLEITGDEEDNGFRTGEKILVVNVHKLFNGRSVFGVGSQGERIPIGTLVIDDVHACLASIRDQFRITIPNEHDAYAILVHLFDEALRQQSPPAFLDIKAGDPQNYIEVPFWTWQEKHDDVLQALHGNRETDELRFRYNLISDVLPYCRCIISGKSLEIAPTCLPTDSIRSFANAKRRIYMTATLADDSVLVTDFGAEPEALEAGITTSSAQDMGERMILMPQELNPELGLEDVKPLLSDLATACNVVVLVPSRRAADAWASVSAQTLQGDAVALGVERLRRNHVGLTVLINRYDGIDLPKDACRILVIVDLPEVASLLERADMVVLGESRVGLRRQIQRIEQGMGRGIRSNEDYCVVLLLGSKLTRRLLSFDGRSFLTNATRAQLDLSKRLAQQMQGASLATLHDVINQCMARSRGWVTASKKALISAGKPAGVSLDPAQVALRKAFDLARAGEHTQAATTLQGAVNAISNDDGLRAWMMARLAETTNFFDRSAAQQIIRAAHKLNRSVTKPLEGVAYQRLSPSSSAQAAAVCTFFRSNFLQAPERLLFAQALVDALRFEPETSDTFEGAIRDLGAMLGINTQRPEKDFKEKGPDNLWALRGAQFLVIECKNGVTSGQGISRTDLGQLALSMEWFRGRYGQDANGVPVMIHPLARPAPDGICINGMRVIDRDKLEELRTAILEFVRSICVNGTLDSIPRVNELLRSLNLAENCIVRKYTKAL